MGPSSSAHYSTQTHVFAILCITALLTGLVSLAHYVRLTTAFLQPAPLFFQSPTVSNTHAHTFNSTASHTTLVHQASVENGADDGNPNRASDPATAGVGKIAVRCVLYDRPPRTGSTTVSNALATCLRKRGFKVNSFVRPDVRNTSIARGLGLHPPSSADDASDQARMRRDYALVATHVWMTQDDVDLLRDHCEHVVYLTSAAPMWERVWSAAKMVSVKERNGNTKLDSGMLHRAAEWLNRSDRPYAQFYNVYPWIRLTGPQRMRDDGKHMEEIPHLYEPVAIDPPFHPHFVIRKDALLDDLAALLAALGCKRLQPRSTNVHRELDRADTAIAAVKKSVVEAIGHENGSLFNYLSERSASNDRGLLTISSIMRNNPPS